MKIYIMLPFTSVLYNPESMEHSAQLTEDYIRQFGSARFAYHTRSGLFRRCAHYTGTVNWQYTKIRPKELKLDQEEEYR